MDNTIGAVGSIPRFLPGSHYIGSIIKVDMSTMEPIRNEDGFCVQCGVGKFFHLNFVSSLCSSSENQFGIDQIQEAGQ